MLQYSQNGKYLPGFTEDASLKFEPGKTYRLRIINMSALGGCFEETNDRVKHTH